jgi:di/tricarboxylate transporter
MGIEIWAVAILVAIFAVAATTSVNMGVLGFAGAFILGVLISGQTPKEILAGFPADLFLTLVGITYLFAIAQKNGSIDRVVNAAAALTGHSRAVIPWLVFAVGALLTGFGALGPAAVAILAPLALRFARQFGLSPLMLGLMTIHGAQAGAFSPVSVYGVITNKVVENAGLAGAPTFIFLASLLINLAVAAGIYLVFMRRAQPAPATVTATSGVDRLSFEQVATLAALAGFAASVTLFEANVGFAAVFVITALAIVAPKSQAGAINGVSWSTVLLICGVITYVALLEKLGVVDWIAGGVATIGVAALAALLLCYLAGIVSAFASSTALLGVVIPLALPLVAQGQLNAIGVVAAIAVSTTIVDTSPFSTNGALVVANAEPDERDGLLRKLLIYTAGVAVLGPLIAWAVLVLPF